MKKAIIFYQSITGTTQNYAHEIGAYLQTKQIDATCISVEDYRKDLVQNTDYIITGCWTKGLLVVFQKPDETWIDFARKMTVPVNARVALFATYKIRTGSMFRNMAKYLNHTGKVLLPNLKSRDGKISEKDKIILDEFMNN